MKKTVQTVLAIATAVLLTGLGVLPCLYMPI